MNLLLPTKDYLLEIGQLKLLEDFQLWKRHAPVFVTNLSGIELKPGLSSDLRHTRHASYFGRYENQYLFGFHHFHGLVGLSGEFNCQELDNYSGRLDIHLSQPPPLDYAIPSITKSNDHYKVDFKRLESGNSIAIHEPVFFGSPIEPANWAMWLLHGLASVTAFIDAGQPGRFMCYAPEVWQQKLLSDLGLDQSKLIQQKPWATYLCDQISLHQYSLIDLVPDGITRSLLDRIAERFRTAAYLAAPAKLYVSRRSITAKLGGRYRALLNEDELINALASRGYVVVEPELLTFEEQVLRFSQASAVVGLGGAAMFNTVFCAPGTKVVSLEGTDVFALNHARFFASSKLEYGFVIGAEDVSYGQHPHNPWTVDIGRALKAIDNFI